MYNNITYWQYTTDSIYLLEFCVVIKYIIHSFGVVIETSGITITNLSIIKSFTYRVSYLVVYQVQGTAG